MGVVSGHDAGSRPRHRTSPRSSGNERPARKHAGVLLLRQRRSDQQRKLERPAFRRQRHAARRWRSHPDDLVLAGNLTRQPDTRVTGLKSRSAANIRLSRECKPASTQSSHRPAQLFAPATDPGETNDQAATQTATLSDLFQQLSDWESSLATVPLWGSSPYWTGQSAKHYDSWPVREEPK